MSWLEIGNKLKTINYFMFYFFDNVFYHVSKAYKRTISTNPEIMGICILSLMQFFNIFTLLTLYSYSSTHKMNIGKPIILVLICGLIIFNYFRYIYKDNHSYIIISQEIKHLNGYTVLTYILVSLCSAIGLAIFLGGRHW
jgi:hypothetical protein